PSVAARSPLLFMVERPASTSTAVRSRTAPHSPERRLRRRGSPLPPTPDPGRGEVPHRTRAVSDHRRIRPPGHAPCSVHRRRPRAGGRRSQAKQGGARMSYVEGDHVVPMDLLRSFVCRVARVHPIVCADTHLLELAPLEGPWKQGTLLVRLDDAV